MGVVDPIHRSITHSERFTTIYKDKPYVIDPALKTHFIQEAMEIWSNRTGGNLQFRERTQEEDYLEFRFNKSSCETKAGRSSGAHVIHLHWICMTETRIILHEIGHSLGMAHEHQRPDRDDYVEVVYSNIDPEFQLMFDKVAGDSLIMTPYDFDSVMHYKQSDGSRGHQITLRSKLANKVVPRYQMPLSDYDVWGICRFYNFEGCVFQNDSILNELGETHEALILSAASTSVILICSFWVWVLGLLLIIQ